MTDLSGIQWGDVGTWVGGLATAGGMVFTGLALRAQVAQLGLQRAQFKESEDDKRKSQARLVAAWSESESLFGPSTPRTPNDAFIQYRNGSDFPAYNGVVTIVTSQATGMPGSTVIRTIDVFPPHSLQELVVDIGVPVAGHNLPVETTFRDSNGIAWRRMMDGKLIQAG